MSHKKTGPADHHVDFPHWLLTARNKHYPIMDAGIQYAIKDFRLFLLQEAIVDRAELGQLSISLDEVVDYRWTKGELWADYLFKVKGDTQVVDRITEATV